MLDSLFKTLRADAGITTVHDFGLVHEAPFGLATNRISAVLEHWDGRYWFALRGELSRGPGFRRTRVVKWPYGRREPTENLAAVIADFDAVAAVTGATPLRDDRNALGRAFDRLIGRRVIGVLRFAAPTPSEPGFVVEAEISHGKTDRMVVLCERAPGRGAIRLPLPQAAFPVLSAAVRRLSAASPPR